MKTAIATEPARPTKPNENFVGVARTGAVLLNGVGTGSLENGCIHGVAWFPIG